MLTERKDGENGTEIWIWSEDRPRAWSTTYSIVCLNTNISIDGERVPPTPHVSLLTSHSPTPEDVRRLATEYAYVAGVAEQLQAEKRAAYADYQAARVRGEAE